MGGFGSAVLEAFHKEGWNAENVRCHGIPDQFVEHSPAPLQRANLKLDAAGVIETVLALFPDLVRAGEPAAAAKSSTGPRKDDLVETVTW